MSKALSVTKYLTNIYKCVIFCVTLFCYTIRNMSIFLIFWNIGYNLKQTFNFGLFLQLTLKNNWFFIYLFLNRMSKIKSSPLKWFICQAHLNISWRTLFLLSTKVKVIFILLSTFRKEKILTLLITYLLIFVHQSCRTVSGSSATQLN